VAECGGHRGGGGDSQSYLQSPAHQDLPAHFPEPAERELDPDGEEQQDDADFGEALYAMYVGDEPEGVGTEQRAGHDEARQGGSLIRWNARMTSSETAKITARSLRTRSCSTVPARLFQVLEELAKPPAIPCVTVDCDPRRDAAHHPPVLRRVEKTTAECKVVTPQ